jgi:hypothetical protein
MCHGEHDADHEGECRHCGHMCHCGEGDCDCGCHSGHHFERRYQTKAEQIEELEAYLTDLKSEVQAVEEHLADLRR